MYQHDIPQPDPLPFVPTSSAKESSTDATTIPHQITLGRPKVDRP